MYWYPKKVAKGKGLKIIKKNYALVFIFFLSTFRSSNSSDGIQIPADDCHNGGDVSRPQWSKSSLGETQRVTRLLRRQGRRLWPFFLPWKHLREIVQARAPLGKGVVPQNKSELLQLLGMLAQSKTCCNLDRSEQQHTGSRCIYSPGQWTVQSARIQLFVLRACVRKKRQASCYLCEQRAASVVWRRFARTYRRR